MLAAKLPRASPTVVAQSAAEGLLSALLCWLSKRRSLQGVLLALALFLPACTSSVHHTTAHEQEVPRLHSPAPCCKRAAPQEAGRHHPLPSMNCAASCHPTAVISLRRSSICGTFL